MEMTEKVDLEWNRSAKGNLWTEYKNIHLVVGGSATKGFWVLIKDKFLHKRFDTLDQAKAAAMEAINEN